jgi:SNF2 family DNA or RNA helicase
VSTRTYGTLTVAGNVVEIDCEAHVRMLLKRVCKSLRQPQGELVLRGTLTDALGKDLQWIQQRYPLLQRTRDQIAVQGAARRYDAARDRAAKIVAQQRSGAVPELALRLRDYQTVAADLVHATGGLLLADELGVGKTASGIGLLAFPDVLPALVVVPTHLQAQWQRELARFAPALRVHRIARRAVEDVKADVLVITYAKLDAWEDALAGQVRTVIFDEVQELRSGPGKHKYDASIRIATAAKWRLGLSATPIHNYGLEFFHVLQVIKPGLLGEQEEFTSEWCVRLGSNHALRRPDELGSFLRDQGVLLRRTRKDVGQELPELSRVPIELRIDLSREVELAGEVAEATELARKIVANRGAEIDEALARGEALTAGGRLAAILRHATGVAKAAQVAAFVRMVIEESGPAILAGWHHDVYDIWRRLLVDFRPVLYTGQESAPQKNRAFEAFRDGHSKLLIMSLRSGAGLDGLQGRCSNLIVGELDWSPSMHEQLEGRIHRPGAHEPVFAYYCVGTDGSDPTIVEALGIKRGQLRGVIGEPSQADRRDVHRSRMLAEAWLARAQKGTKAA